jgi:hypothetical protein
MSYKNHEYFITRNEPDVLDSFTRIYKIINSGKKLIFDTRYNVSITKLH